MSELEFFFAKDSGIIRLSLAAAAFLGLGYNLKRKDMINRLRGRGCFGPEVSPLLFPLCFLVYAASICRLLGPAALLGQTWFFIGAAIEISVFFLMTRVMLPAARRYLKAGTAAVLWLLPNFMYIIFNAALFMERPWLVISLGRLDLRYLPVIWIAGFLAVMGHKIVSHLVFRRALLKDAFPCEDEEILALWDSCQSQLRFGKLRIRLMISPAVFAPVSVGLYRWSIRVLLPDRHYEKDDLKLIFYHELIHIKHCDARIKLFQAFCTAFCWFDPLMRRNMERCSEDLELSCDEKVIYHCGEGSKRRYAELILNAADSGKGFTSCLSSSAEGLRYRLSRLMEPGRRYVGGFVLGAVLALFVIVSGRITLSCSAGTLGEIMAKAPGNGEVSFASFSPSWDYNGARDWDGDAIIKKISDLELRRYTFNYLYDQDENSMLLIMGQEHSDGMRIRLTDHKAVITRYSPVYPWEDTEIYYLSEEPDWEGLSAFFTEDEPRPESPQMHLYQGSWTGHGSSVVMPNVISITDRTGYRPDPYGRYAGAKDGEPGMETLLIGLPPSDVKIRFTYEPESYAITREPVFEGEFEKETVEADHEMPSFSKSCIYRIRGIFRSTRDTIYDCEFVIVRIIPEDVERWEKLHSN